MDAFQQSVEIGPFTAKFIASEINEFCDLIEDQTDACQITALGEKDLRNLIHMVHFYKQKVMEKENIIAGNLDNGIKLDSESDNSDNSDDLDGSAHAE